METGTPRRAAGRSDYNRTRQLRRAFALLALLHHNSRDLAGLAQELGVCTRTVRRDLYALEAAGIPLFVESIPKQFYRRDCRSPVVYLVWTPIWRIAPGSSCPICHHRRHFSEEELAAAKGDLHA